MDEQIKQIAERLRGLRDVLELNAEDIARDCDIPAEEYRLAETGEFDISVSMLQKIARRYGIALDALIFGEEPKILASFTKDTSTNYQEGLLELYKKIHEKALPL